MKRSLTSRTRASVVIVALMLTSVAPRAGAAPTDPPKPPAPLTGSLGAAVSAKLAQVDTSAAIQTAPASAPAEPTSSGSFFKSPKGVAVMLLMAAGTGWAIYSARNERIDNPAR